MAYGHLIGPGDGPDEITQVVQVKVVSGVQPKAKFLCLPCCPQVRLYRNFLAIGKILGISCGVKFHPVRAAVERSLGHYRVRIYEDGSADTATVEQPGDLCKELPVGQGVPSGVGCDGVVGVRDQCDLLRLDLADKVYEAGDWVPLNVEFSGDQRPECKDVAVADVPLVRAGVYGDALGATSGILPPLALRRVAILLIFTLSLVIITSAKIGIYYKY